MPPAWCHLPGAIYMYLVHDVYLVPRIPGATYMYLVHDVYLVPLIWCHLPCAA